MTARTYHKPASIKEACALLARDATTAIAGGTDVLIKMRRGALRETDLVNIQGIEALCIIEETASGVRIGSAATLDTIATHKVIAKYFPALGAGARSVGTPQIRNLGTIGGNVCNASPCADTAPGLLVSDAVAVISNGDAERRMPIGEFWLAPGKNALQPGELLTAFELPRPRAGARQGFLKLGPRRAADISVVNLGISFALKDGICSDVRIALGSVAPTPLRARGAEAHLDGKPADCPDIEALAAAAVTDACPISDVRGSAWYRNEAIAALVTELAETLFSQGKGM